MSMFARYAEYDMYYTFNKLYILVNKFARYAEYDMYYTLGALERVYGCLLGMLNMICTIQIEPLLKVESVC